MKNVIEIRGDAYKLLYEENLPLPREGRWNAKTGKGSLQRGPPKCWHRESRTRKRCDFRPKYFAQPFVFIISMCLKKFDTPTVIFNTRRVELVEVPSDGTVGRGPVNST